MSINLEFKNLIDRYVSIFENRPHPKNLTEVEKRTKSLFSSGVKRGDLNEKIREIRRLINETEIKVLTRDDRYAGRELKNIKKSINDIVDSLLATNQEAQIPSRKRKIPKEVTSEANVLESSHPVEEAAQPVEVLTETHLPTESIVEFVTPGVAANRDLKRAEPENVKPETEPTNNIDAVFRVLNSMLAKNLLILVMQYHEDSCNDIIKITQEENEISDFVKSVAESITELDLSKYKEVIKDLPAALNLFKNIEVFTILEEMMKKNPEVVTELKKLREFELTCKDWITNIITDADIAKLTNSKTLQKLELIGCANITAEGLNYLNDLTDLQSIKLRSPEKILGTDLLLLAKNHPTLHSLSFYYSKIQDEDFASLTEKFPNILSLDLQCSKITDVGLAYLVDKFPNLKSLNLDNCHGISSEGFTHLLKLSHLESLSLKNCNITNFVCADLAKLSSLKFLNLEVCNKITQEGIVHFENLRNLQHLNLNDIKNDDYRNYPYSANCKERWCNFRKEMQRLQEINPSLKISHVLE